MGGNAIAHLMPPPFYAYRYVVAKARAPEESIQDQIDKILDATATNRYKIEVMPGIYVESITMKQYVDVVAPYGRAMIQPASGTAAVTMADDCMLQGMQIDQTNQGAGATGIVIGDKNNAIVEDCWITGGGAGDTGISDASTYNTTIIRHCRIDGAATSYHKTGTGQGWVADCRMTAASDGIEIDIDDGELYLVDNELMSADSVANVDVGVTDAHVTQVYSYGNTLANTAGTSWNIANDADAKVWSHDDKFLSVTHGGAGFMVAFEEPQTYLVHNGMHIQDALTDITDASDTKRYTVKVFSGEYDEAVTMDQYVDLVGESNQSCVISQAATNVITAAANSRIKSVRIEVTAANNNYGVLCHNVYAYLEEVVVIVTHSAGTNYAVGSTGTGGFEIHDSILQIDHAVSFVLSVDGSGNHFVYDSELIHTAAGGYAVNVLAGDSLNSYNNKYRSDNGFYLISDASTQVLSYGDDFTTVLWSADPGAGLFADLTGARLYSCAAGLTIGDWVYCDSDDHVAEADADALATMPSIGVIVYKPGSTTCYVKNYGYLYDPAQNTAHGSTFVAGEEYWISATAGEITTTMHPVWPQRAGVAVDTQRFKILVGDNLGLVHCNEYQCTHGAVAVDNWVYITTTNDYAAPAKADAAATMGAIGVCVAILVTGDGGVPDTILVKLRGKYSQTHADGWVASDDVYISAATAGDITRTMPVGGIIQKVAEVKSYSDTTLLYEIAD